MLLIAVSAAVGMAALAYFSAPIFLKSSAGTESSSEPLPTGAIA